MDLSFEAGLFGANCLYAQVLKAGGIIRVVKVERRNEIGSQVGFNDVLLESADSECIIYRGASPDVEVSEFLLGAEDDASCPKYGTAEKPT